MTEATLSLLPLPLKRFAEAQEQARRHAVPALFGDSGQGDPKKNFSYTYNGFETSSGLEEHTITFVAADRSGACHGVLSLVIGAATACGRG